MEQTFIAVRSEGIRRHSGSSRTAPNKVSVETHNMTASEATELNHESEDFKHLVPSFPLKLIEPCPTSETNEPTENHTWGLGAVGAADSKYSGAGVKVAVIDSGVDIDHPAFEHVDFEVKNFVDDSVHDVIGHGTHCAGTIFGGEVAGLRIGVAPGVTKALSANVFDANGRADTANLVLALNWAAQRGADIISMSLGMDFPGYVNQLVRVGGHDLRAATSVALQAYTNTVRLFDDLPRILASVTANTQAPLIVAAAGNESDRLSRSPMVVNAAPPAVTEEILSVGAVGPGAGGLTVAPFSNAAPDLVGPGVNVLSAVPGGGIEPKSGTSMATPHVAGLAAIWAEKLRLERPVVSAELITRKLLSSSSWTGIDPVSKFADVGEGLAGVPRDED